MLIKERGAGNSLRVGLPRCSRMKEEFVASQTVGNLCKMRLEPPKIFIRATAIMSTYSLLQVTLDQRIDRDALEEASRVASSVARADCARMGRDLFGILISGLGFSEASAFQAELMRWNFPTDLVADDALPLLHEPFTVQALEVIGEVLVFSDAMGRKQTRPLTDLVFMAGGFVQQIEFKRDSQLTLVNPVSGGPTVEIERRRWEENRTEFRLDFFFWASPNRLRLSMSESTTFFYQGHPLRLRHAAAIHAMVDDLLTLLPPERINVGLKSHHQPILYPGKTSYEEEIRWHFYQLTPRA